MLFISKIYMEKTSIVLLKQRAVIEFLNTEDWKSLDLHARLLAVYDDNTKNISNI